MLEDYLDEVTPMMRKGLSHTRINRWLGETDDYTTGV